MKEIDCFRNPEVKTAKVEDSLTSPSVATTTRLPLFNRRQMALRDSIMSRLLTTTSIPIRMRSSMFPARATTSPSRVYIVSLKDQHPVHNVLARPKITKPTEAPAFLMAKFPIMSRNPVQKYQFNRVQSTTPRSVIFRHSEENNKYSKEGLMRLANANKSSLDKLKITLESASLAAGIRSTTANPLSAILNLPDEKHSAESLEQIVKLSKGVSWEPIKDSFVATLLAVSTDIDASADNSTELPGAISYESEEYNLWMMTQNSSAIKQMEMIPEQTTDTEVQSTTEIPLNAISRYLDEEGEVSLEDIQHIARGLSWESIKEQLLIKPSAAAAAEWVEEATEMVARTEQPDTDATLTS
jgi:hypothetical protein